MKDLIFVSLENWDEVWRRNQFVCGKLAERYRGNKILFVGLAFNVSHHLRCGTFRELLKPMTWSVPGHPNISVVHPFKLFPDSFAFGRKTNEWISRVQISRHARKMGLVDPILWLNPHSAIHMAGKMGESHLLYDITDDWTLQPSLSEVERRCAVEQDRALCECADLVTVCSEQLLRSRKKFCREIVLIPNGVDAAHYSEVRSIPKSRKWPGPVFGYTGTLHSERTDVKIIIALARAYPSGSVVLVGPDHWAADDRRLLEAECNVHMTGPVPYQKIPEVMAQFNVCIVPHVETRFTESLNPIKLWEYLAAGKPIVATNIAGFRDYAHVCRIASGESGFVAACRSAIDENDTTSDERMAEARNHSWERRVNDLLNEMSRLGWISSNFVELGMHEPRIAPRGTGLAR